MNCTIKLINYSPVKSLSLQSINSCQIKKNLGMPNDRIFAFSRGIDYEKAKTIEKNPKERKLNNFLTLKNSPVLNKYNFSYNGNKLALILDGEEIISISADDQNEKSSLSKKLFELESTLINPIILLKILNIHFMIPPIQIMFLILSR